MIPLKLDAEDNARLAVIQQSKAPAGSATANAARRLVAVAEEIANGPFLDFEALRERLD
jgi:hypothetical protein